jgi:glycerol-3-phosphate O-acyltransferase/dihydroxyacetone phosphate acyltransferase
MRAFAQLLIRVFFRRVEVEGAAGLPATAPVLVVANHNNGLVDGLLLMSALGRYPRFLGKSTLFRIPLLWPFLKLAGVVPVYRAKEGGTAEKNAPALRMSRRLLAGGGVVAIFPEGISHNEPSLQPLRTGAARIALGAAEEGTSGLAIVPVGLVYDHKARFRSRALVRIGPAIEVDNWIERLAADAPATVRELTGAIDSELRLVSPSYESWQQALVLGRLAAIAARPLDSGSSYEVQLADLQRDAQSLATLEASPDGAGEVAALRSELAAYERDLSLMGVDDAQLASDHRPNRVRLSVASSLATVTAALPLAAAGVVVHIVPYQLMKLVSWRVADEGIKATVKLLGCTFLFTAVYVVCAVLAGEHLGSLAGIAVFVACPVCGYAALRLIERARRLGGLLSGARIVSDRGPVVESVVERRAAVAGHVRSALGQAIRR